MVFDASKMLPSWSQGIPQPTVPVTDLSMHNDNVRTGLGSAQTGGSNATAATQSVKVMNTAAAIVLVSIALLWISGTLVFKGARLP